MGYLMKRIGSYSGLMVVFHGVKQKQNGDFNG